MEDTGPDVTYYALVEEGGTAQDAFGLVRRIHAEPLAIDEAIGNDLEWRPTDYLRRYYLLGSTDTEHVEVSAQFAQELLARWRAKRSGAES